MESLPDEIILQVLAYLDLETILTFQRVCHRLLSLSRDSGFWKLRCYDESRFEANRRRQLLLSSQDSNLAALRTAMTASSLPSSWWPGTREQDMAEEEEEGVASRTSTQHTERIRALASWDPAYPTEKVDFYQDYVQRHAPAYCDWLDAPSKSTETIGFGAIKETDSTVRKVLTAQEDGSIRVWDVASHGGRIVESKAGLLSMPNANNYRETGAVENVSIDNWQQKAYIAISDQLHEVDLTTLQVVRKQTFPFPITVLSEARHPVPMTIGTHMTLHLFDPRVDYAQERDSSTRLELIAGTPPKDAFFTPSTSTAQITLEQPGPTSILHLPTSPGSDDNLNGNIWVAGRFTSLLNYDRRVWPRISGTLFSGARLSSLACLPHPYKPRSLNLAEHPDLSFADLDGVKSAVGTTLIGAGEYKGKGSLELYGLPRSPVTSSHAALALPNEYRNRQTASKTRLISVATHGTSVVFSDGDGNLKWVERDGFTLVREECINDPLLGLRRASGATAEAAAGAGTVDAEGTPTNDDIVQKVLPARMAMSTPSQPDELIMWTGDGKVGVLGFGMRPLTGFGASEGVLAEDEGLSLEAAAEREQRLLKEEEERKFGRMMREALQRQADEVRFVRGLGMGF